MHFAYYSNHLGDYGTYPLAAHTNKPDYVSKTNELVGDYFRITTGCISTVGHHYLEGLNRYQQSFALLHVDLVLKEVIPEHIVFYHQMTVVSGIVYRRSKVVAKVT